ncbi:YL1 nuclear protein-domain-containing protein [Aspergillus varians]
MSRDEETSSSEDEILVESLIQGREKRSTAGRQMSALLDAEADDDLALLFEEVDDDNEFSADVAEEGGEEEDMGLESSSDDEDDQGPSAQTDDLEGEQQIEKEEKEEKKKRRAREDLRYGITSKKVKIDPTAARKAPTTAPRPRKKSERVSWIPASDEGPTRSSSRRQTMQNKELTHARLKDSEEKRIRLIATMEEAAKRKAKHKPKSMTQAERLLEAERVERHNSKSLNRWEEMEKRKAEERRAKIEALQNRRLEGPVISYWSGVATWADGRLTHVGKITVTPKPEKEDGMRKKSKKADREGKNDTERKSSTADAEPGISHAAVPIIPSESTALPATNPMQDQSHSQSAQPAQPTTTDASHAIDTTSEKDQPEIKHDTSTTSTQPAIHANAAAPEAQLPAPTPSPLPEPDTTSSVRKANSERNGDLQIADEQLAKATDSGTAEERLDRPTIQNSTSQPDEAAAVKDNKTPGVETSPKSEEKPSDVSQLSVLEPPKSTQLTFESTSILPASDAPVPTQSDGRPDGQGSTQGSTQAPVQIKQQDDAHADEPNAASAEADQPAAPPAVIEHTGRCLTVLENFDDKTAQSRDFSIYFNAKKPPRLTKISSSLCVITSLPSRYRDPDTSLPFANSYAYHEIRHTAAQKYSWSPMLGCYVGPSGIAARGVPERFLDPNAKEHSPKSSGNGDEPNAADKEGDTAKTAGASNPTATATITTPTPTHTPTPTPALAPAPITVGASDAMDIDK